MTLIRYEEDFVKELSLIKEFCICLIKPYYKVNINSVTLPIFP